MLQATAPTTTTMSMSMGAEEGGAPGRGNRRRSSRQATTQVKAAAVEVVAEVDGDGDAQMAVSSLLLRVRRCAAPTFKERVSLGPVYPNLDIASTCQTERCILADLI